jgi:polyisoprenoid-binding protein YceI
MKLILLFLIGFALFTHTGRAQKIYTKNGNISFFSATKMENIKADNNQVMSVLNTATGELQFSVIIKNFHFEKALMEEHFNENYLESSKYPKAVFKGIINAINTVNFTTDGSYPVQAIGELTLHGVTNKLAVKATLVIKAGKIAGQSTFMIALADYKIQVPKLVEANIAKTIEVKVNCLYDQKL